MASLAYTFVRGVIVKEPELRIVGENQKVAILTLAVNHSRKKESVSFFSIEAWGKNAEICSKHLKKGARVTILGDLRQDRWTDDKGEIHSRTKIIARQIHLEFQTRKIQKQVA
ncbi:MAG: single-stranded DNA-binding protein [Leptospiraceae bacterium]|nr:single-stranded DNA-binding protein [Leptospiraceae bacterium]